MCGLFGYHVRQWKDELYPLMALLATMNQTRGTDAYGWTNGKVIFKDGEEITKGFHTIPFKGETLSAFHTRAGTAGMGKTGKECAHPWDMKGKAGTFIGMHNGYIGNHQELNKEYDRKFPVDSMHLVAHLADGRPLDDVEFHGVCLYFNNGKGPFMFRTASRDIEIARLVDDNGIIWSSDWVHLRRALDMLHIQTTYHYKMTRLNTLYEFGHELIEYKKSHIRFKNPPPPPPTQITDYLRQHWSSLWERDLDKSEVETYRKPQPVAGNFKRSANIGQWRRLHNSNDLIWAPCYHVGAVKLQAFPVKRTCGCAENTNFQTSWPIIWRPIGEWRNGLWNDCWHNDGSSSCRCQPFTKKLSAAQADGNVKLIGPVS